MCDTQVLREGASTWFAKNSDREPGEPQQVCYVPAVREDPAKILETTYIEIPQVPDRHAVVLSRPLWMWGAEMGVNDSGVVIGNEAVFSRLVRKSGESLLGMDLLRLALERSASAEDALQCITTLLAQYGQGGPAGYRDKNFRYDNSFLIADAEQAWVLETAGRYWVAKKVECEAVISNAYSIQQDYDRSSDDLYEAVQELGLSSSGLGNTAATKLNFAKTFDTGFMKTMGCADQRRAAGLAFLQKAGAASFPTLAASLRQHRRGSGGARRGSNADVCMHAGSLLRPSQTCSSMLVHLERGESPIVMMTGTSAPCLSLFQGFEFPSTAEALPGLFSAPDAPAEKTLWHQFESVHRRALTHAKFRAELLEDRDRTEAKIMALVAQAQFKRACELGQAWHRHWRQMATAQKIRRRWYSPYDHYWARLNRKDAIV